MSIVLTLFVFVVIVYMRLDYFCLVSYQCFIDCMVVCVVVCFVVCFVVFYMRWSVYDIVYVFTVIHVNVYERYAFVLSCS